MLIHGRKNSLIQPNKLLHRPDLGTYTKLIDDITKDFSPYDAPKDAIYEMKELKMGNNTSIEEHVSKFKMLVTQSKLAKNDAVTEYF